ncbi:hypothetical protein CKO15_08115 [Halorhodospira abdelmalekii]|uniref:7TM diverse intracellular signaling domain-containing protein n=1 Tax=Halorhodospira abdelmalekii TaxID=421629 RepID=UPI0019052EF2|nr:7TM diverse intracellular signaling domain-containing protein [Halorhodospira abdelmalekii]MBK1735250.1 hypothetical protein [Halorhodospira abdelmalekii]
MSPNGRRNDSAHPAVWAFFEIVAVAGIIVTLAVLFPLLLALFTPAVAASGSTEVAAENRCSNYAVLGEQESYAIEPIAAVLRDPSAELPFAEIRELGFVRRGEALNFGYTDDAIWVRLCLREIKNPAREWFLVVGVPYLDEVDAYQEVDGEIVHYRKGRGVSIETEPYPHRDSIVPVHFDNQGRAEVYLRFASRDGVAINSRLITESTFTDQDQITRFMLGGYFGAMLSMALYNLFLFFSLRESRYIYYVLFIVAVPLNVAAHYELLREYLFYAGEWLDGRLNIYTFCLAILASIQFTRSFLLARSNMPKIDFLLRSGMFAIGGVVLYATVVDQPSTMPLFAILVPLLLVIAAAGLQGLRLRADPAARFFLAAFGLFIVGVALFSFRRFGFFPSDSYVNYTFLFGSVLGAVLLSFALASQITLLRNQKEKAQADLIRQISEHNRRLEQLRDELEEAVRKRTLSLVSSLREKEVLLLEVHHRVKNNLAIVGSLLGLQIMQEGEKSAATAALRAGRDRIHSMALAHELLYVSEDISDLCAIDYLTRLLDHLERCYSAENCPVRLHVQVDNRLRLPIKTLIACGLIVNELVTNAYQHAFVGRSSGEIWLSLVREGDEMLLRIEDNGHGMPIDNDENFGLKIVRIMAEQLSGEMKRYSGSVNCVQVRFPFWQGTV